MPAHTAGCQAVCSLELATCVALVVPGTRRVGMQAAGHPPLLLPSQLHQKPLGPAAKGGRHRIHTSRALQTGEDYKQC